MTPREELAGLLRQARVDAGYRSHSALAAKMCVSRPVVTRAESANQPVPSGDVLTAWSGVTGIGLDQLTELAERCRSGSPDWFMDYAIAESRATMLRCWGVIIIPGLLQTEAYAHAVLSAYPHTPERVAELVAARMQRQRVLDRAHLTAAIGVPALSHCLGSPQVMADQLRHLAIMAEQPNIGLHVVPDGSNHGVWAGVEIASHGGTATVCLTTGLDDVTSTASAQIDNAMQAWERVTGSALPVGDSLECMRRHEGQWKDQI